MRVSEQVASPLASHNFFAMQLTHLGPYEIGKPLGKGGMGSVYEAHNIETGERVAVKALTPHLALAEGFRERFEAEIESLKSLKHDGIVRLYGYGEENGVLFYSMELVDGTSLDDELKAGRRFNWREVTNIAIQLSLALKHAHDHGIVHRDIKPANVLVYDDDKVKLADFGIARLFGTNQLTTAGGVLGTADYMSPEQADGRPVTARCDQYSLGGVMYALLAGRPPFRAANLPQMLQLQRFAKPEPVRAFAPDTPEQLERVIAQLLSKEPAERFPNMQVLARHLQAMAMALSRPTADDFALTGDDPNHQPSDAGWENSISIELTKAESFVQPRPRAPRKDPTRVASSAQDAATLAANEVRPSGPPDSGASAQPPVVLAGVRQAATDRPARFTTVEEEQAQTAASQRRSWPALLGQFGVFAVVMAAMAGIALFLAQPPTADKLYQIITTHPVGNNPEALAKVSHEIDEFLNRFPADPRAEKMRTLQEQIALDKLERKLQRTTSGSAGSALLPIEQMYLRAVGDAADSPESAAATLQAIVDLHPAGAPAVGDADATERTAAVVRLAGRRLEKLSAEVDQRVTREHAAARERMQAAKQLEASNPQAAKAMYRAIIDLYSTANWAKELVATAREQLAQLEQQD